MRYFRIEGFFKKDSSKNNLANTSKAAKTAAPQWVVHYGVSGRIDGTIKTIIVLVVVVVVVIIMEVPTAVVEVTAQPLHSN